MQIKHDDNKKALAKASNDRGQNVSFSLNEVLKSLEVSTQ